VDFFDVKGVVEGFCRRMGAPAEVRAGSCGWLAPGRSASIWVDNRRCGDFGQLSPALAGAADLPSQDEVYAAEIDLDALDETAAARGDTRVAPLPRFPSVIRDVSVLVADTLPAASVLARSAPSRPRPWWTSGFDRYRGKGIPEGRVSLSLRLTFRSAERTLTDAEVQEAMDAILAALAREHGAVQR
jgi:phenylalanyl-tRNA synthetase beta chain